MIGLGETLKSSSSGAECWTFHASIPREDLNIESCKIEEKQLDGRARLLSAVIEMRMPRACRTIDGRFGREKKKFKLRLGKKYQAPESARATSPKR